MVRFGSRWARIVAVGAITLASVLYAGGTAQAAAGGYTALGDSYSSGVGSRAYDYDKSKCQRSNSSFPVLAAKKKGLKLTFAACTGARVPDVVKQLDSVPSDTAHVTVQVGGNDVGFVDTIKQCAKPWPTTCWGDIDNGKKYIKDTLPGKLNDLYDKIRAKAPNASVVVVGYPILFAEKECNAGTRISVEEQRKLNEANNQLTAKIGEIAKAHNFRFVDPRASFRGHAVCDNPEWINGLSNPITESFHPNKTGHSELANLVVPNLG